jgi:co-chaperonin GroES (HSP10)
MPKVAEKSIRRICSVCQSEVLERQLRCHSCRTDYTLEEFHSLPLASSLDRITIKPTYDRVLLEFAEPERQTPGGLFIPDKAQETVTTASRGRGLEATVLAVGPGRFLESGERLPLTVKPGDRVLVPPLNFPVKMGQKKVTDWRTGITTLQDREVYIVNEAALLGIHWRPLPPPPKEAMNG